VFKAGLRDELVESMDFENEQSQQVPTLVVEVSPAEVSAGETFRLKGRVSGLPAQDLRGSVVLIRDQDDQMKLVAELVHFEGEVSVTGDCVVEAPIETGTHTWTATLSAGPTTGHSSDLASAKFSFSVKPHAVMLEVWDGPPTVVVGERFRIKVGIKCSGGCQWGGTTYGVYDHEGERVATGESREEVSPGTTGLFFGEQELEAPDTEGLYRWAVRLPPEGLEIPHEGGVAFFQVRVVERPDCLVMVEAIDGDSQIPIKGANVVMHPYRASTDEHGVAELYVPKGTYVLFMSGRGYVPVRMNIDVTADMTIGSSLFVYPPVQDDWVACR